MNVKKQLKRCALAISLALSLFGAAASFADNVTIGRYLSVAKKPQRDQQRLLQQQIQVRFPQNVLTLQQAATFLLQFSGYRLIKNEFVKSPVGEMLNQPLPEVDKNFGPMTLEQGLITLVGKPFYLLIDPVNRLVSFKLKPEYKNLYTTPKKQKPVLKTKRNAS